MPLSVGIVGLPNAGKSTLFNAITESSVPAENYPFCTIKPNTGVVPLVDERVDKLCEIFNPLKKIYSTVSFIDIAGIVKNAHKGEGLGNQFLSHIREVSMILFVIRVFNDESVVHTENTIDPKRDFEILKTELLLADISTVEKRLAKVSVEAKSGKKEKIEEKISLESIMQKLSSGSFGRFSDMERETFRDLHLFSFKKFLIALNFSESDLKNFDSNYWSKNLGVSEEDLIPISAKIESEFVGLSEKEKKAFLRELDIEKSSLEIIVEKSFESLGLIQFFTAGEKEVRSWQLKSGSSVVSAASEIHTDFAKKFIKAEVINWKDLYKLGDWVKARESGKVRQEGKEYIVQDGDTIIIKHNA